jgi:hypothetical protein
MAAPLFAVDHQSFEVRDDIEHLVVEWRVLCHGSHDEGKSGDDGEGPRCRFFRVVLGLGSGSPAHEPWSVLIWITEHGMQSRGGFFGA